MKLLYTSTDLAFTQLVRMTFDREEIGYYCSDADGSLAGLATPMGGQSRFYIADESDWDRAVELLREMGAPVAPREPRPIVAPRHNAWLTIGIAVVVTLLMWAMLAD